MQHRRALLTTVLLALTSPLVACVDTSQLQFVQDQRLDFTRPDSNEIVETPFKVAWTMENFEVLPRKSSAEATKDEGYFAVFVDRSPVKPNHTLEDVGEGDPACESDPRCPNPQYLNAKGVYVTHEPRITLDVVAPLLTKETIQRHEVTVVLMDSEGRRIGESAWYLKFKMENRTSTL